jgi:hypothetical protein
MTTTTARLTLDDVIAAIHHAADTGELPKPVNVRRADGFILAAEITCASDADAQAWATWTRAAFAVGACWRGARGQYPVYVHGSSCGEVAFL